MIKKIILTLVFSAIMSNVASASLKNEYIQYSTPDSTMEGYLAYDDAITSPKPGILIVHDWMGLGQYTKEKADLLASQGYVAFAVDIYGKGIRPTTPDEAKTLATKYKSNRPLLQAHIKAAYDTLIATGKIDPKKILVMGYCFGGTTALELARSGVPLAGTVSFHGGLSNPTPENAKNIHGDVLILHGADDPLVPPAEVEAFKKEMKEANVDYTFIAYTGAVHAFTNPNAGNDPSKGMAYNADADNKSWDEFEHFLKKVFP